MVWSHRDIIYLLMLIPRYILADDKASTSRVEADLLSIQIIVNIDNDESLVDVTLVFSLSVEIGSKEIWVADIPISVTSVDLDDTTPAIVR